MGFGGTVTTGVLCLPLLASIYSGTQSDYLTVPSNSSAPGSAASSPSYSSSSSGPPGRRRLSPSESVIEAINGTHHRRLAPLESLTSLLKQIEASKQASLQTKNHSKRNRI